MRLSLAEFERRLQEAEQQIEQLSEPEKKCPCCGQLMPEFRKLVGYRTLLKNRINEMRMRER